jgi:hypothetical protein
MEAFQERVVKEKKELDNRLEKLRMFLENNASAKLPEQEQVRLTKQGRIMTEYSDILQERIDSFQD